MGPQLLIDKSALQSLTEREARLLGTYYFLVVPPVLMGEICADLEKARTYRKQRRTVLRDGAMDVARKLLATEDRAFSVGWEALVRHNLIGGAVEMQGRPVASGTEVQTRDGRRGWLTDEKQEAQLVEWAQGNFSVGDRSNAKRLREALSNVDLEGTRRTLRRRFGAPSLRDSRSLVMFVEDQLADRSLTESVLAVLLKACSADAALSEAVRQRWRGHGCPLLGDFAPFAAYCQKVLLLFHWGIMSSHIPTRPSNAIDVEYLMYLPFGLAFTSGDKFHAWLTPLLARQDQVFIPREELRGDLQRLADAWEKLEPSDPWRESSYPPELQWSITAGLWKWHMRPREDAGLPVRLTSDEEGQLVNQIRAMTAAQPIEQAHERTSDEGEFLIRRFSKLPR